MSWVISSPSLDDLAAVHAEPEATMYSPELSLEYSEFAEYLAMATVYSELALEGELSGRGGGDGSI